MCELDLTFLLNNSEFWDVSIHIHVAEEGKAVKNVLALEADSVV